MVLNMGNHGKAVITCEGKNRRGGFTHIARATLANGNEVTAKICYVNRTWETYRFQSVIKALCEKIAIAIYGVPSVSALWNTKKWSGARGFAESLLAQV